MKAASWKRVQRLAYPFYVLTYVHLALLLMPSALAGNDVAVLSIAVYSIVMGAYVILRLRKAAADHRAEAAPANPGLDLETVAASVSYTHLRRGSRECSAGRSPCSQRRPQR